MECNIESFVLYHKLQNVQMREKQNIGDTRNLEHAEDSQQAVRNHNWLP